ncbi:uncharacterized protein LOC112557214 isoform X1 [Pomacea canaliculata]|uniref:uncharacterized protein LOC112557214 isoform X1 n=2 Tax=Pomacea canaliculata TaxID=400727 RepID=UPI000D734CC6|nr:uncharacterized protein LOC112557214 isoform X1 [Pomacea canaliculata]
MSKLPATDISKLLLKDAQMLRAKIVYKDATASTSVEEIRQGLLSVLKYGDERERYTHHITSPASATCNQIEELTYSYKWMPGYSPGMMCGNTEAQFLKTLVSIQGARRVLEVGMFTGYSALAMAEALPPDGVLVTCDTQDFLRELNEKTFANSPHGKKIQIKIGPAVETMREFLANGQKFDFIFLDADQDVTQVKIAFEEGLLAKRGTVVIDNAYHYGHLYDKSGGPQQPERLWPIFKYVQENQGLHKVLVSVRDGVLIVRRLSDVEYNM